MRTTGWRIIWKKIIAVIDATFAGARINLSSIALMFQHRWCQVSRPPLFDLFLSNTVWWMTNKRQGRGTREVIHHIPTLLQGSYRSWKTWKVMRFKNFIFKAWKIMEFVLFGRVIYHSMLGWLKNFALMVRLS